MITIKDTATAEQSVNLTFSGDYTGCLLAAAAYNIAGGDYAAYPTIGAVTCGGVSMNLVATYESRGAEYYYNSAKVWIYYLFGVGAGLKTVSTALDENPGGGSGSRSITAWAVSGVFAGGVEEHGDGGYRYTATTINCVFTNADANGVIVTANASTSINLGIITSGITANKTVSLVSGDGYCGHTAMAASFSSSRPMGVYHFT
jgi:hypothetical protein